MNAWWLLASIATATVAWYVRSQHTKNSSPIRDDYAVYVIGDLHGDVECARQWVQRTGLIQEDKNAKDTSQQMTWVGDATAKTSHLVFMGDYIDKGITSKQTVEYVQSLTDQFPTTVTALMGNHELELLRDRTHRIWGDQTAGYFQLPFSSAHPAEYLNYLDTAATATATATATDRRLDEMVIETLYNASLEVYARGLYRSTFITPDLDHSGSILHLIPDAEWRDVVRERLVVYQKAYLDAYRTGTPLGTWLEQRPVAAVIHGTLFVHGGVSLPVARFVKTSHNITRLNALLAEHAVEPKLQTFLQQHLHGRTVYDMLTFRGNHKDTACDWLPQVLPEHTTRLALGHTPSGTVRIRNCRGSGASSASSATSSSKNDLQILALDSALSRWFRNSGNDYCLGNHVNVSSDGRYECGRKSNRCQGQIVRIVNDKVQVLEL
jgi:Calcineurin-like phosphoesterase